MNPHVRDNGLESQCGFLRSKSCNDAVFPLKTALQLRKEHGLESFVVFVDLVKAFDTVNHELMFLVLEKYGYPPRMVSTIRKMYEQFSLCIKKGEEEELIDYLIGVHQGDNLAPLLFVLVFQAAMETLELTEERAKISSPTYRYFPDTKKGEPRGRMTGHNVKSKGTEISHWLSLYADDSAFILPSRDDAKRTANLVKTHLQRFGLQMHTGTDQKKSKTEVLHVPAKGEKSTPSDIQPIILTDNSQITFTSEFTYLGSIIASSLSDDKDVLHRITKANSAFGSLRSLIFGNRYLPLKIKRYLYMAIPINLLLWGSENWALSAQMLTKLESFHTKSCRAILGITMWEVSMYKVKNKYILSRLGVPSMKNIIHYRRLMWMQKIAAMPITRYPRIFLNAWVPLNRPVGRPNLTTRQSFLNSLHYCDSEGILKFNCPNGKLNEWVKKASDSLDWTEMTEKLRDVRIINEVDFYKTYYN